MLKVKGQILLLLSVAAAGSVSAKRLAIFGDSVSDNGNGEINLPGPYDAGSEYELFMRIEYHQ